LHQRLGLGPETFVLEMDAGCGGAVHAISAASQLLAGGAENNILVVAANVPSQYYDHWEAYARSGAWLSMYVFGDGAGAVVLRREQAGYDERGILATYTAIDSSTPLMEFIRPENQNEAVYFIDGRAVATSFRQYARLALEALQRKHPFNFNDVRRFYFHQVNANVLRNFVAEIGIPEDRVAIHVDRYGNLAAAATLVLLDEDIRERAVGPGDLCVICTVGAGAQYGAILLRL
jgi:3-oxoacyl-[acyl-carrier-protein] synthase-3